MLTISRVIVVETDCTYHLNYQITIVQSSQCLKVLFVRVHLLVVIFQKPQGRVCEFHEGRIQDTHMRMWEGIMKGVSSGMELLLKPLTDLATKAFYSLVPRRKP